MGSRFFKLVLVFLVLFLIGALFVPVERETVLKLSSEVHLLVHSKRRAIDVIGRMVGWKINSDKICGVTILAHSNRFDFDLAKLNLPFRVELATRHSEADYFVVGDGSGSDVTTFYVKIMPQGVNLDVGTMALEAPLFSEQVGIRE